MTTTKPKWTLVSFVALDFFNGIAIYLFLWALLVRNLQLMLGVVAVYGVIVGLAKAFGVLPEGYKDHLLRSPHSETVEDRRWVRRWPGVALVGAGLAIVVWVLVEAPNTLIDVISRGAEPAADIYEVELVRLALQFLLGVILTIFGIRMVRERPD